MTDRVALYARVSTREQHPENQLLRLRAWAAEKGLEALEFEDAGISGARRQRPALGALLDAVRRHEVSTVAAVKLDRLARSSRHLCELAETFQAADVDLVVLDQCVDTRTPAGKLLYHVLGAVAEFERDLIKERTLDGLERARRAGTQLGRPSVLDRQTRSRIQRLQRSGHTVREIAEKVDLSVGTVHKALHL